jgi:hypothetical protein
MAARVAQEIVDSSSDKTNCILGNACCIFRNLRICAFDAVMTHLVFMCGSNDAKRICIGNQIGLLPFRISGSSSTAHEVLGSSIGLQRLAIQKAASTSTDSPCSDIMFRLGVVMHEVWTQTREGISKTVVFALHMHDGVTGLLHEHLPAEYLEGSRGIRSR